MACTQGSFDGNKNNKGQILLANPQDRLLRLCEKMSTMSETWKPDPSTSPWPFAI